MHRLVSGLIAVVFALVLVALTVMLAQGYTEDNSSDSQNVNTNVKNTNSNNSAQGGWGGQGGGGGDASATQANTQRQGSQSVKIETPRQAPAAIAPGLAAAPETCMGSTALGASSPFGGLSFGTTWKSENCDIRMTARMLEALGQHDAALATLATIPVAAEALRRTGFKAVWFEDGKDLVKAASPSPMPADFARGARHDSSP